MPSPTEVSEQQSPVTSLPTPPPSSPSPPGFTLFPPSPGLKTTQRRRNPFFAIIQTHIICSCPQRHTSPGPKLTLRILPRVTAEQNIEQIRKLLDLEPEDEVFCADEDVKGIVPDYEGLLRKEDPGQLGARTRVIVFVTRGEGEMIARLERENKARGFRIYEEPREEAWVQSKHDEGWPGHVFACTCDECLVEREIERFVREAEQPTDRYGWMGAGSDLSDTDTQSLVSLDEAMTDASAANGQDEESEGNRNAVPEHEARLRRINARSRHRAMRWGRRWNQYYSEEGTAPLRKRWSPERKRARSPASMDKAYHLAAKNLRTMR